MFVVGFVDFVDYYDWVGVVVFDEGFEDFVGMCVFLLVGGV